LSAMVWITLETSASSERTSPEPAVRQAPVEPVSASAVVIDSEPAIPEPSTPDQGRPGVAEVKADDGQVLIDGFDDLIKLASDRRDRLAVFALERHVRPIRCEPGHLDIALTEDADPALPQILTEKLLEWTGMRWVVAVSPDTEIPSIHEARSERRAQLIEDARSDPLVAGVLDTFPGAAIVDVRERDTNDAGSEDEPDLQIPKQSKEN